MSLKQIIAVLGSTAILGLTPPTSANVNPNRSLEYVTSTTNQKADQLILESLVENFDATKRTAIQRIEVLDNQYLLHFRNGSRTVSSRNYSFDFLPDTSAYDYIEPKEGNIWLRTRWLEPLNDITIDDKKELLKAVYSPDLVRGGKCSQGPTYLLTDDKEPELVSLIKELMGEDIVLMTKKQFSEFTKDQIKENKENTFDTIAWKIEKDRDYCRWAVEGADLGFDAFVSVRFESNPYYLGKGALLCGSAETNFFFKIKNNKKWIGAKYSVLEGS